MGRRKKREYDPERFYANIKYLAKKNKMTLAQVADSIGVTSQSILNWGKGANDAPMSSVIRLADLFNVTVDGLMFDIISNRKNPVLRSAPAQYEVMSDPATFWKGEPDKIKVCGKCGRPIDDDARFCKYCGNEIAGRRNIEMDTLPVYRRKPVMRRPIGA